MAKLVEPVDIRGLLSASASAVVGEGGGDEGGGVGGDGAARTRLRVMK